MTPFFQNKTNRIWCLAAIGLLIFNVWNIVSNTPMVPDQHWAQKIFYVHVPSAWVGFLSYLVVMIAGITFFVKGDDKWDDLGLAAAEIGTLFTLLTLVSGSIWAKPVWGTWWTSDPQLTTTLILFILYFTYLVFHKLQDQIALFLELN